MQNVLKERLLSFKNKKLLSLKSHEIFLKLDYVVCVCISVCIMCLCVCVQCVHLSLCILCLCMCAHSHTVYSWGCECMCTEARGQPWLLFLACAIPLLSESFRWPGPHSFRMTAWPVCPRGKGKIFVLQLHL